MLAVCSSSIPGHQSLQAAATENVFATLLLLEPNYQPKQLKEGRVDFILSQRESTAHPAREARVKATKQRVTLQPQAEKRPTTVFGSPSPFYSVWAPAHGIVPPTVRSSHLKYSNQGVASA